MNRFRTRDTRVLRRPSLLRTGVAVLAAGALTTLSACGGGSGGSGGGSASDTQTLTIAYDADAAPNGYDPLLYGQRQFEFFSTMYDALFVTDGTGAIVPSLATGFTNSADNLTTTLTLKQGVTFTDGSALDSSVVKANLDRRSDTELAAYNTFAPGGSTEIADVAAPDPQTVVLTWAAPQASPDVNLADTYGTIVGPTAVADPSTLATTPDGSGPYTLATSGTTKGSSYSLEKNAEAWNADAFAFDEVVVKVITDDQALANAVVSGQADVATQLDSSTVDLVESRQAIVKSGGTIVGFPVADKTGVTNPAFGKVEVRQALSYGIDRASLVTDLHPGARATAQLFPESAAGFDPAIDERYAYDPAKAKELLATAGYPDGFSFDITVLGQPADDQIAIQKQWQEIGVTMNFVTATSTDAVFAAAQTEPMLFGPFGIGSKPAGFVAGVLVGGFVNLQKATDPAIEGSLGAALGATGDAQETALTQLNAAITDRGWFIPVYEDFIYTGYNAEKVGAPAFAGDNGFLVLSSLTPAS
ncbi:ABC transporter substrate-binding protein [Modestobacter muralis]|uniref:ABC transporter substrate-binding protein n=1 Tax=Modestobacter muralis TaxID=1608614 RepID=A0A6P0HBG5_9ACTN|nr:ABC transporter substrate-binding protein [Modestobacter muralis]NEK95328.1 ABC transporter substrate-binding protein [Modestobacter muralis]NEN52216.1 ABC transporter substrate-binding protein [Modestobacter muralis]